MRTIVPLSSLLWRRCLLIPMMAPRLAALIRALIVLCSTDFLGDHDRRSRLRLETRLNPPDEGQLL